MKKRKKIIQFIRKNHLIISLSLVVLFLLLWNLDRYFPICPYGVIPLIIAIILEIIIISKKFDKLYKSFL